MRTFIKVVEIWIPSQERTQLELAAGIYGALDDFKTASKHTQFNYNEGLPGTAWALGRPEIINEFNHSCIKRAQAATNAGLTCAIALPIFSGEFLMSVVVFFCGDGDEHSGAIEVWSNDLDRGNELGIIAGYYGTQDYFEFVSRKTKIMKGFGLPGQVWEEGLPILMSDLGESEAFIRGRDAKNAGITTALGIPLSDKAEQVYIMTFLSAKATPIARQLEIWLLDHKRGRLIFKDGFSDKATNLRAIYAAKTFAKGEDDIGRVWLTGTPIIVENYGPVKSTTLMMPVIRHGELTAVVVFCL